MWAILPRYHECASRWHSPHNSTLCDSAVPPSSETSVGTMWCVSICSELRLCPQTWQVTLATCPPPRCSASWAAVATAPWWCRYGGNIVDPPGRFVNTVLGKKSGCAAVPPLAADGAPHPALTPHHTNHYDSQQPGDLRLLPLPADSRLPQD